jgi:hypothetical protein
MRRISARPVGVRMRAGSRKIVVVGCVAVAALFLGLSAYNVSTMGAWATEELGVGWHWCYGRYFTEMMVDSEGNPHVIYTGEGIVHARDVGGGWVTTEVPAFNSGYFFSTCCALMDDSDSIHVFVSHEATVEDLTDSRKLVHITNAGGSWTESYIDGLPGIDYYNTFSCVAGPGGELHVLSSGATRSTEPGDLQNLRLVDWHFDGASWNVSSVLSLPEEWDGVYVTDVKLDDSGDLHAVGIPWQDYSLEGLMYARSDGSQWSMELLPWSPDALPAKLALGEGTPYVGFRADGMVTVASGEDGVWTEFVELWTRNDWASPLDIAFDGDGALHVLYGVSGSTPNLEAWHTKVEEDGNITREKIGDNLYTLSFPSILVDDDGDVHTAFSAYHSATYATDGIDPLLVRATGHALLSTALIAGVCVLVGAATAAAVVTVVRLRRRHVERFDEGD